MIVLCEQGKTTEAATKTAGIYYWKNNLNGKGYVGQSLDILKRTSKYIGGHFSTQRAFYSRLGVLLSKGTLWKEFFIFN